MTTTPHEIPVSLGDRSYPIYCGAGMEQLLGPTCRKHSLPNRLVIICDRNVATRYLKPILRSLKESGFEAESMVLPAGERHKNLSTTEKIYTHLLESHVERSSGIIALGGGVIGDLAGFAAATYLRGLPLIQMPTTLLAQVDSSVGGKTGVNHRLGKNMVGAFYQPVFVWSDAAFLQSLPAREVICGLGEIIKYGIILDGELFTFVQTHLEDLLRLDPGALSHVQRRCCELKADVVSKDERESGLREVLNYGHTIGHGLEAAAGYKNLSHGEAVLLGMIAESYIAQKRGLLPAESHREIEELIRRVPLRLRKSGFRPADVLRAMGRDKKVREGSVRYVLPVRIGQTTVINDIAPDLVKESLRYTFGQ